MDTPSQCEEIKRRLESPPLLLIVEDCEADAAMLQQVIPIGKAKSIVAKAATPAQRILETIRVDLILLDLTLGPEDGIALLEWLKTKDIHIPVAVVTGCQLGELAQKASQFDILTILPKPVSSETIMRLMQQLKIWKT